MADLLPGLSSDEEAEFPKEGGEDQESDNEIDESFEFGGILGEDGGFASFQTGWSYQKALDQINDEGDQSVPRLDIASLISAKRKRFTSRQSNPQDDVAESALSGEHDEDKSKDGEEEEEDDDDSGSEGESESGDYDGVKGGSKKDTEKDLGEDILKTRAGERKEEEKGEENESDSDDMDGEKEDKEEAAKAKAFFDDETDACNKDQPEIEVFPQLALSRPLLRGIATMGFVKPTPIQSAVIPLALQGRDICASAVTGSGKTAAFVLPILERLLHRYLGRTKVIILTPTRELAAQCVGMLTTLAQFTNIRATLIVGGNKNVNAQAAELRTQPEIIVATPGRLLDHVTNSAGVTLEDVEFLVLDEADRLLDLGFQDEVHEIIQACPFQRQTMLFSATMNTKVDDLIKISLKKPVRVRISDKNDTGNNRDIEVAPRLEQEFVRVRPANEGINREAMLLALLTRTFTKQVIVFFDMKSTAHRLMIICGLNGIKCTELHGNLTQQQRLTALEDFRTGEVDVLLATDLAARGLDIDRVSAVINFEMPVQIETYIHRIGRTARAGRGGCSCTLVGEGRRHLMKELIKDAEAKLKRSKNNEPIKSKKDSNTTRFETGVIRSRTIPPAVTSHFAAKIEEMESHVAEIMQAEVVAKMDRVAEMEATRAENIIAHSKEINARPKKEWFANNKQKEASRLAAEEKQKMIEEKVGTGMHRMSRKKRRAREALAGLNAPAGDGDDDAAEKQAKISIKASVRAKKREEEKKKKEMSVHDVETTRLERKRKTKGQTAVGDSSLFDDERIAHSSKKPKKEGGKSSEVAQSSYNFRGFDPDKKLGKKKGVKAFKSKSKHKRRK